MTVTGSGTDWVEQLAKSFDEFDVNHITYLPDSRIWPPVDRLRSDEQFDVHAVTREEEVVGMVAGDWDVLTTEEFRTDFEAAVEHDGPSLVNRVITTTSPDSTTATRTRSTVLGRR